jgi:site-specific recombinase XerD
MKQKKSVFTIKPFKNRNGVISFRVAGWLLGERIRKNFKTREDAVAERAALETRVLQSQSNLRGASTFLTEAQLREAEAAFLRLEKERRPLTFYLDYALANYREPEAALKISDAIETYLKARKEDVQQSLLSERQLRNIRLELAEFQRHFPTQTLAEVGTEALHAFIRRDGRALKTQNNRRGVLCAFFNHALRKEWVTRNPVDKIQRHRIEHSRGGAEALTAERAAQLMAHVKTVHGGAFVPYFALCLFAGIRPDGEISKLPAADVRLENNAITIEPWVSKVNMRRLVTIQPCLAAWLRAYPLAEYPIIPPKEKMRNVIGKIARIRKQFAIGHDVLRHTFISMHVAKFRSMGDTALQAGNSESIIRRHYLNVTTLQEAKAFFGITPAPRATPKKAPKAKMTETATSQANTARGGTVAADAPPEAGRLAA